MVNFITTFEVVHGNYNSRCATSLKIEWDVVDACSAKEERSNDKIPRVHGRNRIMEIKYFTDTH